MFNSFKGLIINNRINPTAIMIDGAIERKSKYKVEVKDRNKGTKKASS